MCSCSRPNFYSSSSPSEAQFQGNGPPPQFPEDAPNGPPVPPPGSPGSLGGPPLPHGGPPLPQSPPGQPPPHGFHQGPPMNPPPPGQPPAFHANLHGNRPPQQSQQGPPFPPLPDMQQNMPYPAAPPNTGEFFGGYYPNQAVGPGGRRSCICFSLLFSFLLSLFSGFGYCEAVISILWNAALRLGRMQQKLSQHHMRNSVSMDCW